MAFFRILGGTRGRGRRRLAFVIGFVKPITFKNDPAAAANMAMKFKCATLRAFFQFGIADGLHDLKLMMASVAFVLISWHFLITS